jgi:hypothetical protein
MCAMCVTNNIFNGMYVKDSGNDAYSAVGER